MGVDAAQPVAKSVEQALAARLEIVESRERGVAADIEYADAKLAECAAATRALGPDVDRETLLRRVGVASQTFLRDVPPETNT